MNRITLILVLAASVMASAQQPTYRQVPQKAIPVTADAKAIPYTTAEPVLKPRTATPYAVYKKPRKVVRGGKVVIDSEPTYGAPDPWQGEGYAYIPILFNGNWSLGDMLKQGNTVPNPDAILPPGNGILFDGVPFFLQEGNNVWSAYHEPGPADPHELTLPARLPDALEVYTVINSLGGVPNKEMLWLEFKSTCGLVYRVAMRGNRDIRDWRDGGNSNLIAPPTLQVWGQGLARLDMQSYKLPREFQGTDGLASVRVIDGGSNGSQRVVLVGVTVRVAIR